MFFKLKPKHKRPDLVSEKIISHKYKFVWLSIPKAASRSLITALYRKPSFDIDSFEYIGNVNQLFKKYPETLSYYKFAFVRNPWSRVVSTYKEKICNEDYKVVKSIISKYPWIYLNMPFEEFIDYLCSKKGQDKYSDRHWISQYKLLQYNKNEIFVDFIGKIENIEDDIKIVSKNTGMPDIILGNLNSSKNNSAPITYYREYYNERTKEMISKRYSKDIELFNYSF